MKTIVPAVEKLTIEQLTALLPATTIVVMITEVTAEVAGYILDTLNTHNRQSKPRIIDRYRTAMEADAWRLNGATIVFTDKRRLGDGQNRLIACRTSGMPFKTLMVFGVEDSAFDTIDQGKPRSHEDILKLKGSKDPRNAAIAVRWVEWVRTKQVRRRPLYTPQQTGQLWHDHKGIEDFLPEARKIAARTRHGAGVVAAFLYLFDEKDPELAAQFTVHWQEGILPPRFRAIAAMGAELDHLHNSGQKGGHRHEITRAAVLVNAWNIVRKDRVKGFSVKWDYDSQLFPEIL